RRWLGLGTRLADARRAIPMVALAARRDTRLADARRSIPMVALAARRDTRLADARRSIPMVAFAARRDTRLADARRSLQEHRPQDVRAVEELRGRAVEADLALLHEVRGLGDRERDVHRLLDEDDRRSRLAQR